MMDTRPHTYSRAFWKQLPPENANILIQVPSEGVRAAWRSTI